MDSTHTEQDGILMEIREANLNYLMLARQMIRSDKLAAIFRLGISLDIANFIDGMSNSQLIKLASANMMLARFRFDDTAVLGMLTSYTKSEEQASAHTAILMSGQAVEDIC